MIRRLRADFSQLDRTDDFIAYVSAADGVGGDYLTTSQLMRRCVSEEQLYRAMPHLKEKDLAFKAAVTAVEKLPLVEQVKHWVAVIDGGEFGEGSMRSFWKTDYEAYEQLIRLGSPVIPYIQKFMNGDLKQETKYILEMVLKDSEGVRAMERLILDTDIATDVDDAMALALALRSPELHLEGVTTVYGDVRLRARLAKKLLLLGGREEVPVYAGIEQPLLRIREIWWPGHEGEGVLAEGEEESLRVEERHAVDFIVESVMAHPGQITLVPIGPLTNIAAAIIREPRIIRNVKRIVLMGGVTRLGKNGLELPPIEHNIKCDPEAAAVVFSSGAPIVMAGLDVTMQVRITRAEQERLLASKDPMNQALGTLIGRWLDYIKQDSTCMHDPLAVSLLIDPTLVTTRRMRVTVEYDQRHPTGTTVAVSDENGAVDVALDVDSGRFLELLMNRLNP